MPNYQGCDVVYRQGSNALVCSLHTSDCDQYQLCIHLLAVQGMLQLSCCMKPLMYLFWGCRFSKQPVFGAEHYLVG
jgi:hypothetical protein